MSATIIKNFALTSSHHLENDVIDFYSKDDIRYYLRGEKPLISYREDKFNCTLVTSTVSFKIWMRYHRSMDGTMVAQESPGEIGAS